MPIEREKIDLYISNAWIDTFRLFHDEGERYSWWTYRFGARDRNVGWRIDYFMISSSLRNNVVSTEIHNEYFGSDHCPISLNLSF